MFDIRQISNYIPNIHSRYYIDTCGNVYTSLSFNTTRITVDGHHYNIAGWKKANLPLMNSTNKKIIPVTPIENRQYFMMDNGLILQRLKTQIEQPGNSVFVSLLVVSSSTARHYYVSRLAAKVFIGDIENKEVHHIDQNRFNNRVENLSILSSKTHHELHKNLNK